MTAYFINQFLNWYNFVQTKYPFYFDVTNCDIKKYQTKYFLKVRSQIVTSPEIKLNLKLPIIALAALLPAPIALIAVDSPKGATSPPAYTFVTEVSPFH